MDRVRAFGRKSLRVARKGCRPPQGGKAKVAVEPLSGGPQKPTCNVPDHLLPAMVDRSQPRRPWLPEGAVKPLASGMGI